MWEKAKEDWYCKLELTEIQTIFAFSKVNLKKKAPVRYKDPLHENHAYQETGISTFSSIISMNVWQITSLGHSVDVETEQHESSSQKSYKNKFRRGLIGWSIWKIISSTIRQPKKYL